MAGRIRLAKDRRTLNVVYDDGASVELSAELLRVTSPSAEVQGHSESERKTIGGKRNVRILSVDPVGNYAVRLGFDDMHNTGIYSWVSYMNWEGMQNSDSGHIWMILRLRASIATNRAFVSSPTGILCRVDSGTETGSAAFLQVNGRTSSSAQGQNNAFQEFFGSCQCFFRRDAVDRCTRAKRPAAGCDRNSNPVWRAGAGSRWKAGSGAASRTHRPHQHDVWWCTRIEPAGRNAGGHATYAGKFVVEGYPGRSEVSAPYAASDHRRQQHHLQVRNSSGKVTGELRADRFHKLVENDVDRLQPVYGLEQTLGIVIVRQWLGLETVCGYPLVERLRIVVGPN